MRSISCLAARAVSTSLPLAASCNCGKLATQGQQFRLAVSREAKSPEVNFSSNSRTLALSLAVGVRLRTASRRALPSTLRHHEAQASRRTLRPISSSPAKFRRRRRFTGKALQDFFDAFALLDGNIGEQLDKDGDSIGVVRFGHRQSGSQPDFLGGILEQFSDGGAPDRASQRGTGPRRRRRGEPPSDRPGRAEGPHPDYRGARPRR